MANKRPSVNTEGKRKISIALQGGGALGAYTWGVLDKLLEDGRIEIEGISGTSAGAVNATALAVGLAEGGNEGARAKLREVWEGVGKLHYLSPFKSNPWFDLFGLGGQQNPMLVYMNWLRTQVSPYMTNPGNFNPLRDHLNRTFDYSVLNRPNAPKLFIAATNVKSGALKLFKNDEMSSDAILASACLPDLFQAVKIGNEHYWDGGYASNPNIESLIDECKSSDLMMIQINPVSIDKVPTTAYEIAERVNEVSFNAGLMAELRSIEKINKLIDDGKLKPTAGLRPIRAHMIERPPVNLSPGVPAKLNIDPNHLEKLFKQGRESAELWLAANFDSLGKKTSFSLPLAQARMEQGFDTLTPPTDAPAPPAKKPVTPPPAPQRRRLGP